MLDGDFQSYWSATASYETIVPLINMDYDGLKTAIIEMLSGAESKVNTITFRNDAVIFLNKDDVYKNSKKHQCSIEKFMK